MKFLYFDCIGGASGDMILGAFLDGLVSLEYLTKSLNNINLKGYRVILESTERHHIRARKLTFRLTGKDTAQRHLSDILKLIEESSLSPYVKQNSTEVFRKIGEQEARIHGIPVEKVHFHEVGAIDSILDIVGVFICREATGAKQVFASPLPVSGGFVNAAHGNLPLPAPAALALMQNYPLKKVDAEGELVTPTGAALITHLSQGELPVHREFRVEKIGYGAGSRDSAAIPNLLRIWQGTLSDPTPSDTALQVETNIDDLNPEIYPYLMQKLISAGVMDVSIYPNIMKKGRPGVLISVLCDPALLEKVQQILLNETSTLGLRYFPVNRLKLPRKIITVDSPYGPIRVKEVQKKGRKELIPEYDVCRGIAEKTKTPLKKVYETLIRYFNNSAE